MNIGYARVSTLDQNLDLQLQALKKAGCKKIFRHKVSSASRERPEFQRMLDQLRNGDTVLVWKTSGGSLGVTGSGFAQGTGVGHKLRVRGVMRYSPTTDPKLAALSNVIMAIEAEIDPATDTLKGEGWEWK